MRPVAVERQGNLTLHNSAFHLTTPSLTLGMSQLNTKTLSDMTLAAVQ